VALLLSRSFRAGDKQPSVLEYDADGPEKPKPGEEREEMDDLAHRFVVMLDLGNQIGGGDVDEVAGGEGQEKSHVEGERGTVRNDAADQESER
jgi:hypothetical protein